MKKIVIVHFQPLEKYPPVMNIINTVAETENLSCKVYTTENKKKKWFVADKIDIKRVARQHQSSVLRYCCYIQFNVITFFCLIFNKPKVVVAFETYSVLPVYLYKKIFKNTIAIIHHHEYVSLEEINRSSIYTKFLHSVEKKLYIICNYISQTNAERMDLFLKDYPFLNISKTIITPNFPPQSWYEFAKLNKKENKTSITKLVHVGAISLNTMHTRKIVEWVIDQNGKYKIDFYTDNITNDAKHFFDNLKNENVRLLENINYFELPEILINYDIGITIYNGHIPNYIYNVPNKILEYLACGLNVWYSSELISTQKFCEEYKISGCLKVSYSDKNQINIKDDFAKTFNENLGFEKLLTQKNEILKKANT